MVRQPRGNALLVGVGGTGKQSLTRLAAHMCGYKCFQIELTRGYNYETFHEDLKKLYVMTGVKDENTVFLFTDTQVYIMEDFAALKRQTFGHVILMVFHKFGCFTFRL